MTVKLLLRRLVPLLVVLTAGSSNAIGQTADRRAVARNLVRAGMVKQHDKVLIIGSIRDAQLMEDIAIEAMKVGAEPLISISSERLARRSYDDVPATYDTLTPNLGLAIVNTFDVQIAVDVGETEGLLAGVAQSRRTARAKAGEPVNKAFLEKNVRFVNLGNGLYPTATLSRRLGVPQARLSNVFWRAAATSATELRTKGEGIRSTFASGKQVTVTHPNGTNLTFAVDASRGFVSDGMLTAEKIKQGPAAASTWLPAGELILPARAGMANGKVVIERHLFDGKVIRGLTLTFKDGRLVSMTGQGIDGLKEAYDAAGGAKDEFGYIDIGLNPETRLPLGSGRLVWTANGSVVIGVGDNRGFGGTNASDFALASQLGNATVKVDGRTVIDNGALR
ncbi:MAG: aminopeptidase [Gemmatimonadaceae bacterium]|nr:aminopeptidase [Gemmatimonadaceae bacterium]MDQ3242953.1 aminopeptidase [Gemmatimonadota bacterium]